MPGIKPTMDEFAAGTLKSGSGAPVTNPKQAIAIGLNEQRKLSGEPAKGKTKPKKKTPQPKSGYTRDGTNT